MKVKRLLQPADRARRDNELVEAFKRGYSIGELAIRYELSVGGVRGILERSGVEYRSGKRSQKGVPSGHVLERVADGHRYGLSEAGRMHDCSRQNIHILMNRWKVWLPMALEKFPV